MRDGNLRTFLILVNATYRMLYILKENAVRNSIGRLPCAFKSQGIYTKAGDILSFRIFASLIVDKN
jgi:hypothetical protein